MEVDGGYASVRDHDGVEVFDETRARVRPEEPKRSFDVLVQCERLP